MAAQTNPTHTTTPATEGSMDTSSSPMQANTAVTTDGFKDENEITQQPQDESIVVPIADDTGAVEGSDPQQQQQQQQCQKQQQQQQGTAGKLRSVFGRSKKGAEEVEGQAKGEEEGAAKHKGDIL